MQRQNKHHSNRSFAIIAISLTVGVLSAYFVLTGSKNGPKPMTADRPNATQAESPSIPAMSLQQSPISSPHQKTLPLPAASPEVDEKSDDRIEVLRSILAAKNDNDPRLDSYFKNLSQDQKRQLQFFYQQLSAEDLNSRGTTIFLLGREIKESADIDFLISVAREPVCLSVSSCSQKFDGDDDTSQSVTLAYPQLMALRSLRKDLSRLQHEGRLQDFELALVNLARSSNSALARTAQMSLASLQKFQ